MNLYCTNSALDKQVGRLLGNFVATLLRDPAVREVSANYEPGTNRCCVFVDYGAGPMQKVDAVISVHAIEVVARILATLAGKSLDAEAPCLNCVLPSGVRFHAALAPVSDAPRFSIRKHAQPEELK